MENKILIVGTDRKYLYAEKGKLTKSKDYISAAEVVPYGFDFKFGSGKEITFTYGKFHDDNIGLSQEEFVKKNLNETIKGLEEMVKEAKADFVLLDDLNFLHESISGRGQLLIKR